MSSHRKSDGKKPASLERRVREFERHVVEKIDVRDTHSARKAAKRTWLIELKSVVIWCGLWLLLTLAALFARGAWPFDETRVLGIAWEMWSQHRFAAPVLNGEPQLYPPLFFWLVHLGWLAFGVSEWWARLVGPIGALTSLFLVQRVARLLWHSEQEVARYAPLIMLGMLALALMVGTTSPDTWTLALVLLSYWGLLIRWRGDMRAWIMFGVGLGFGALNAGLIVLAYVLPVALVAPLWARAPRPQWKYWYVDLFKSLALAAALFGVWLAAAGAAEGTPYVVRLLAHAWDGTPLALFARQQPWWWYALLAPVAFLPWSVMPLVWMRLWYIRREPMEDGFVLCLLWIVLSLLVLSVLPVKQAQFLLPLLPAGALLTARLLFGRALLTVYQDKALAGMAVPLLILGGVQMALPRLPRVPFLPALLWEQSSLLGLAIMGIGIASAWLPLKDVRRRVSDISALCTMLVVFVVIGVASQFDKLYPVSQAGQVMAQIQARGQPLAHVGEYRGEFQFAARLATPLAIVGPAYAERWAAEHPTGVLIAYLDAWQPRFSDGSAPLFDAPFQDGRLRFYSAQQILASPRTGN